MDKKILILLLLLLLPAVSRSEAILAYESDGMYYIQPITILDTDITIDGQVVSVSIDQTFDLSTLPAGEVPSFYYPLPEDASVVGFGRWMNGELHYYDLTPSEDPGPGGGGGEELPGNLQDYILPNPFIIPIEDLDADSVTLHLEYTQLMSYEYGIQSFTYPLENYTGAPSHLDSLALEITVHAQRSISNIMVTGFYMALNFPDPEAFFYQLCDNDIDMETDFVIDITVNPDETGMWVMPFCEDQDSLGHFLAIFDPGEIQEEEVFDKTFIFVLDFSRSMLIDNRIDHAREAASYCLESLSSEDYFNVIGFEYDVTMWQEEPQPATNANIASAIAWINRHVLYNGTDLNSGMLEALSQFSNENHANQIMLVSDGRPEAIPGIIDVPTILENINEANNLDAAIFTVGVGNPEDWSAASNLDFMRMIAYMNNGMGISIPYNSINVSDQITGFFDRFASPAMVNITCDWNGLHTEDVYPPSPYSIFAGTQTLFAGRFEPGGSYEVDVHGRIQGRDTTMTYGPFEFTADSTAYSFVPRMWAIEKIDYWLAWMSVYGESDAINDMIQELALRYGIYVPGHTDFETPVETDRFPVRLALEKKHVRISWQTFAHADSAQYHVYRSTNNGRSYVRLTSRPITRTSWLDTTTEPGVQHIYRVEQLLNGSVVAASEAEILVPTEGTKDAFSLYPNPFNAEAKLNFTLETTATVRVDLFNILGQQVATLANSTMGVGQHKLWIDANQFASGTYFLHMQVQPVGGQPVTRIQRLVITK